VLQSVALQSVDSSRCFHVPQISISNYRDCVLDFEFSASEQEFYAGIGFTNESGRCPECRAAKKAQNQGGGGYGRQERQMFPAVCATCGKDTMVPFQPSGENLFIAMSVLTPST